MVGPYQHLVWLLDKAWAETHITVPAGKFAEEHGGSEAEFRRFQLRNEDGRELRNSWALMCAFPHEAKCAGIHEELTALDQSIQTLRQWLGDDKIRHAFRNGLRGNETFTETVAEITLHASLVRAGYHQAMRVPASRTPGKDFDARALVLGCEVNVEFKYRSFRLPRVSELLKMRVDEAAPTGVGYDVVLRTLAPETDHGFPASLAALIEGLAELARRGDGCGNVSVAGRELFWDATVTSAQLGAGDAVESVSIMLEDPAERTVRYRAYTQAVGDPMDPDTVPPQFALDEQVPMSKRVRQTVSGARAQLPAVGINVVIVSTHGAVVENWFRDAAYGEQAAVRYLGGHITTTPNGLFSSPEYADLSAMVWADGFPILKDAHVFQNPFAATPLPHAVAAAMQQALTRQV